ncbi:MAG: ATP synthase F1 subunit epsilon [Candidatus Dojkabacteria bacterium]
MIKLKIITPEGISLESDDCEALTVTTEQGVITILDDHSPLVTLLKPGEANAKIKGAQVDLAISYGVCKISRDSVVEITSDLAQLPEEIDIQEVEESKRRAEKYMEDNYDDLSEVEFTNLQRVILQEQARLQLGKKYKNVGASA